MKLFTILLSLATMAMAASLQQVSYRGDNPSGIAMHIYVPENLPSNAAIIVALHYYGGSAQAMYTSLPSYADQNGFIVIYPSTTKDTNCWDCYSTDTMTRFGGGDLESIINMVTYTLETYSADASRVFAMGSSLGAMMTNVLAGVYPDVFSAGASFAGVPCACWFGAPMAAPSSRNTTCPDGQIIKTDEEWGDCVRNAAPGIFPKPRMQIWHGTADFLVQPSLLGE